MCYPIEQNESKLTAQIFKLERHPQFAIYIVRVRFYIKIMTTGEIIKILINAEIYAKVRCTISDEFINFVREMLPSDYDYIAEKEQAYQNLLKLLSSGGIS